MIEIGKRMSITELFDKVELPVWEGVSMFFEEAAGIPVEVFNKLKGEKDTKENKVIG